MSQDIVDRLVEPQNVDIGYYWNLADEAADEITKLRQQRDELVECLESACNWIDRLGGVPNRYRGALAKIEGEK